MSATAIRWVPVLVLEGLDLEPGISTTFYERLSGSVETAAEAMATAREALRKRPDALSFGAKPAEPGHTLIAEHALLALGTISAPQKNGLKHANAQAVLPPTNLQKLLREELDSN